MKKVVLATRNLGKVEELERMLNAAHIDVQVPVSYTHLTLPTKRIV